MNCVAGGLEYILICATFAYRLASLFTRKQVHRELVKHLQKTKIQTRVCKSLCKFKVKGRIKRINIRCNSINLIF